MSDLPEHIHFVGIGGVGVSALAQVALARGVTVSGSDPRADPAENPAVARLLAHGARIFTSHRAENVPGETRLIVSSAAIAEDNPELMEAHRQGIAIISRADFLGQLMDAHAGPKIAVAGTHGKTTTTAMIGVICQDAGLDPTVFVGGEVAELGGNVRVGSPSGPFVAEACEAYESFLSLRPDIAVVTNLESDHLDHYGTEERLRQSFRTFIAGIRPDGVAVLCEDDPGARSLADGCGSATEGYGIETPDAEARATDIAAGAFSEFTWHSGWEQVRARLEAPGIHNVLNALAAMTVCRNLNLPADTIVTGLSRFRGVRRRQDLLGEMQIDGGTVTVIDDYAHHPAEIAATLSAMRAAYPGRPIIAVFQPHLYSRTRDFMDGFATALAAADALIVTDIYAAREAPIEGVRAADIVNLAARINPAAPAIYVPNRHDVPLLLMGLIHPGSVVLTLGAGDIREQGEAFLGLLQSSEGAKR